MIRRKATWNNPPDRGIKYGMGLFETIKVIDGKPQFLRRHLDRLIHGVDFVGIQAPGLYEHLLDEIASLPIQGNNTISLTVADAPNGYNILVSSELRTHNPYRENGLKVTASVPALRDAYNPLNQFKTCNYLLNYLTRNRAREKGFDEVLFLNQFGGVTEGTFTNFFFIKGDTVLTPPPSEGLLPGIFREVLTEALRGAGIKVEERRILFSDEIGRMDGAFVTNSLIPMERVSEIDGVALGTPPLYGEILDVARTLDSTIRPAE